MSSDVNPRVFGKYEVIRRVAVGGMGEIFLARQTGVAGFDRLAILKSLLPQLAADESMLKQFLDEARIVGNVNHPNVVGIFEVGEWEGLYFIAMEYINGVDISALLKAAEAAKRTMPVPVVASVIRDAAFGLDAAHEAVDSAGKHLKIVHRDISPQNIMVRSDGLAKVVDFGVALSEDRSTKTETGMLKGKLGYMSPEQIRGELVDPRHDQWALGVCMWEMLVGKRLFAGENPAQVFMKILQEQIALPSTLRPDVPREVDAVVMRMLARDPAARFARCNEVAAALRKVLDQLGAPEHTAGAYVKEMAGDKLAERVKDLTPSQVRIQGIGATPAQPGGAAGAFCSRCGNRAVKTDRFCRSCGTPLGVGATADSQTPSASSPMPASPGTQPPSGSMPRAPGFAAGQTPASGAHAASPGFGPRPGSSPHAQAPSVVVNPRPGSSPHQASPPQMPGQSSMRFEDVSGPMKHSPAPVLLGGPAASGGAPPAESTLLLDVEDAGLALSVVDEDSSVVVLSGRIVGEQSREATQMARTPAEVLRILLAELGEVAMKHGGHFLHVRGGQVVVLFGQTGIVGDEASRAVMCGLGLMSAAESVGIAVRRALTLRLGLVGETVGSRGVAGATARAQARADVLADAARTGAVLVEEKTQRLADARFRWQRKLTTLADPQGDPLVASEYDAGTSPTSLFGRAFEVGVVQSALDSVLHEQPVQVFLAGEPGTGKTILLSVAERVARERGFAVGRASGGRIGVGASFDVVRQLVRSLALDAASALGVRHQGRERIPWNEALVKLDIDVHDQRRLRAFMGDVAPDETVHASRRRMLTRAAVHAFFVAVAKRIGAVLILDDADRADAASLHLLADICGRMEKARLGLFAAAASGANQKILPGARKVELIGLPPQAIDQLTLKLLDGAPLAVEARAALLGKAQGNPLHATFALQHAKRTGLITRYSDLWVLVPGAPPLPPSLAALVHARHQGLSKDASQALNVAAMVGLVVPKAILEACATGPDTLAGAYDLVDAGVLIDVDDGTVAFSHATEYDAAPGRLNTTETRALHQKIAEAIERTPQPQTLELFERLAGHYAGAELRQLAAPLYEKAADRLALLGGSEAAADLYRRVLHVEGKGLQSGADEERVGRAFGLAARATAALCEADPNAAADVCLPLLKAFPTNTAPRRRAEALGQRGHALVVAKRFEEAERVLEEGLEAFPHADDPRLVASLMDDLATALEQRGDFDGAIAQLLEAFRVLGKLPAEQRGAWEKLGHLARLYTRAKKSDRAREAYTFALDDARRAKNLAGEAEIIAALAGLTAMGGDPTKAADELATATQVAETSGDLFLSARLQMQSGRLLAQLARTSDAAVHLRASVSLCERVGWEDGAQQARQALAAIGG